MKYVLLALSIIALGGAAALRHGARSKPSEFEQRARPPAVALPDSADTRKSVPHQRVVGWEERARRARELHDPVRLRGIVEGTDVDAVRCSAIDRLRELGTDEEYFRRRLDRETSPGVRDALADPSRPDGSP